MLWEVRKLVEQVAFIFLLAQVAAMRSEIDMVFWGLLSLLMFFYVMRPRKVRLRKPAPNKADESRRNP